MSTIEAIRRALGRHFRMPWRAVRYRITRYGRTGTLWYMEVARGGEWGDPPPLLMDLPDAWGLREASARVLATLTSHDKRDASGLDGFDRCCGGAIPRGTTTLLSGGAGVGKTTLAVTVASAMAQRGTRVLYVHNEAPAAGLQPKPPKRLALFAGRFWYEVEREAARVDAEVIFVDTLNGAVSPRGASRHGTAQHAHKIIRDSREWSGTRARRPSFVFLVHKGNEHELYHHEADAILELSRVEDVIELRTRKNRNGPDGVTAHYEFAGGRMFEADAPR